MHPEQKPTPQEMKEWIEEIKRKHEARKRAIADGKIITKESKENENTGICNKEGTV